MWNKIPGFRGIPITLCAVADWFLWLYPSYFKLHVRWLRGSNDLGYLLYKNVF